MGRFEMADLGMMAEHHSRFKSQLEKMVADGVLSEEQALEVRYLDFYAWTGCDRSCFDIVVSQGRSTGESIVGAFKEVD